MLGSRVLVAVLGVVLPACALQEVSPGHYTLGLKQSAQSAQPGAAQQPAAPASPAAPAAAAAPAASPKPTAAAPAPNPAPNSTASLAVAAPAPGAGSNNAVGVAGQTKQSPKNKSAAGDATRRHFPTVFGIILGDEIIHQMPNCGNERADRCFEEMNQASWADVFLAGASSMAGAWQPAVAGNPVRIEGFSMPDWVAPLAPVVGSLGGNMWNDMLLAVQVRASGIHPDFRDDLVGKFGPPLREGKKSFRNAYGKVWSAPMLEWQSSELHVQFVPDDKQDDEAGWGVLLIETDAAYKARKEFEAKQRAERVKP